MDTVGAMESKRSGELPEIACLYELWASHCAAGMPLQQVIGKLLLDTLGLGNQQVFALLYGERPEFDRFREWIVETVGLPDARLLSRYHAWLLESSMSEEAHADLEAIAAMEPVLGAEEMRHWDEQGYVVLREAVRQADAAALRELVWQEAGASPDQPDSWYAPKDDGIMIAKFQHPTLDVARTAPRIRKAFAQLWGSENLWATIDRIGFNPPVREDYPFAGSDLHWDVSLARPIPFGTQAVLYLTDTAADQGAFRCVPGFHRRIDDWLDGLGTAEPRSVDLCDQQVHVPARAGDMVIWRQDLPHGASPNTASSPRLVQYVNFYSPDMTIREVWH